MTISLLWGSPNAETTLLGQSFRATRGTAIDLLFERQPGSTRVITTADVKIRFAASPDARTSLEIDANVSGTTFTSSMTDLESAGLVSRKWYFQAVDESVSELLSWGWMDLWNNTDLVDDGGIPIINATGPTGATGGIGPTGPPGPVGPGGGDAVTSLGLGQFALTTSAELYGVLSDETGSGTGALAVFNKSPRFNTDIAPASNGGAALGTTVLGWGTLHVALNWTLNVANGNAVISHSTGAFTVSTGDLRVAVAGTNAISVATLEGTQTFKNKTIVSPLISDPVMTGIPTAPTAVAGTATNQVATCDFVTSATSAAQAGLDVKPSCRVATTANITLTGTQTIDDIAVGSGDRILVKNQTTASTNGIYVCAGGAWARSSDADTSAEVTSGLFTFIEEGTTYAATGWVLSTSGTIILGTTALTFTQFSGSVPDPLTVSTIIGGTGTTSTLTLQPTSGVGTTGANVVVKVGNNGATTAATFSNYGNITYLGKMAVEGIVATGSKLVCDGNSLTRGYNVTSGYDYPSILRSLLGGTWSVSNLGVDGQSIVAMNADAVTEVDPLFAASNCRNVCIVWEGIINIGTGQTAAQTYAELTTYIQGRQAAGFYVVILTQTKWGTAPGGEETSRQSLNTLINANTAGANLVVDVAADSRFSNTADTVYFNADTVHLTARGYAVVAELIAASLHSACSVGEIVSPKILGGTATTSGLILQTTSGAGVTGADLVVRVGNNGATEAARITNAGLTGLGCTPLSKLDVSGGVAIGAYAGINAAPTNGMAVSGAAYVGTATTLLGSTPFQVQGVASQWTALFQGVASAGVSYGLLVKAGTSGDAAMAVYDQTGNTRYMQIDGNGRFNVDQFLAVAKSASIQQDAGIFGLIVNGVATTSGSRGIFIQAGTNSSDYALYITNKAGGTQLVVYGDGTVAIGGTTASAQLQVTAAASTVALILKANATPGNLLEARNSSDVAGATINSAREFTNTGGQTNSEKFGAGASVSATNSLAVGNAAIAAFLGDTVIGYNARSLSPIAESVIIGNGAQSTGGNSVVAGSGANASGLGCVLIGNQTSSAGFVLCTLIGYGATATANNQLVLGSTVAPLSTAYFGPVVTASPTSIVLNATGGSGTNIAGASLTLAGGKGTGTGVGGSVIIKTSTVGTTGTTLQTLTTRMTIPSNGAAFSLPVSAAPTSPVDGDVWREANTTSGLKARINGSTETFSFGSAVSGANPTASVGLSAVNGSASTFLRSDGAPALDQAIAPTWSGVHTFTPTLRTSGSAAYLTVNAPADTGLTASTEAIGVNFVGATRQHATGALAAQSEYVFGAPTYSFVGASTLTEGATVKITDAPIPGTSATITRGYALWVVTARNTATRAIRVDQTGSGSTIAFEANTATTGAFNYGFQATVSGAGTTNIGFRVAGVSGATNNQGIYIGSPNVGANNYCILAESTGVSAFTGGMVVGNGGLATNATDGFLYIPSCAGTPSGTPTTFTNCVPVVYDRTNDILYIYRSGWKKATASLVTGAITYV